MHCRIDPEDIKKIWAFRGTVIELEESGKHLPGCWRLWRYGTKAIQIDGITRENAQVGLDEKISITRWIIICRHHPQAPDIHSPSGKRTSVYLSNLLEDCQ